VLSSVYLMNAGQCHSAAHDPPSEVAHLRGSHQAKRLKGREYAGRLLSSTSTITILLLFNPKMEDRRPSRPRHCDKDAQCCAYQWLSRQAKRLKRPRVRRTAAIIYIHHHCFIIQNKNKPFNRVVTLGKLLLLIQQTRSMAGCPQQNTKLEQKK